MAFNINNATFIKPATGHDFYLFAHRRKHIPYYIAGVALVIAVIRYAEVAVTLFL